MDGLRARRAPHSALLRGRRIPSILALLVTGFLQTSWVWSHIGAPYLVAFERKAGPYTVTVWTDPDVGNGRFFILATTAGRKAGPETAITVQARPGVTAAPAQTCRAEFRPGDAAAPYLAVVPFEFKGVWQVRVGVAGPSGRGELSFPVEVTPPFPTMLTTVLWLLPFLIVGMLWWTAARQRRHPPVRPQADDSRSTPPAGARTAGRP